MGVASPMPELLVTLTTAEYDRVGMTEAATPMKSVNAIETLRVIDIPSNPMHSRFNEVVHLFSTFKTMWHFIRA
jgi:hypothetical protein